MLWHLFIVALTIDEIGQLQGSRLNVFGSPIGRKRCQHLNIPSDGSAHGQRLPKRDLNDPNAQSMETGGDIPNFGGFTHTGSSPSF